MGARSRRLREIGSERSLIRSRPTALIESANANGATSVRIHPHTIAVDPGIAAARQAANRQRLADFCEVEASDAETTVAHVDRTGRPIHHARLETRGDLAPVMAQIRDLRREWAAASSRSLPIVCCGSKAHETVGLLAEERAAEWILLPVHAPVLGCVGLILANIHVSVEDDGPPTAIDLPRLRERYARLMDRTADAILQHGYDLDDAICERWMMVALEGQSQAFPVHVSSLATTDEMEKAFQAWFGPIQGRMESVGVRSLCVQGLIETPKPDLPATADVLPKSMNFSPRPIEAPSGWEVQGDEWGNTLFRRRV